MKTTHDTERQCGSRVYNSINCNNKIRKVSHNKFERILLCGKHAFNYSVFVENKDNGEIKETIYPDRQKALVAFAVAVKRYDE